MKWDAQISNVVHRIPENSLLRKAVKKAWMRIGDFPLYRYRDEYGTFAYRFAQAIICAKEKPYGYLVSCHYILVLDAKERKIPILMWLDSQGCFYSFDPNRILNENEGMNDKGNSEMINFSIKLGQKTIFKRTSI